MTINERVSDELLEQMSAGRAGHGIEYGYAQIRSIARELQQYRAAAEPVAWRYRTTDINGNPNPRWSFSEEASLLGLYQPLYAAPQVTSVPEELLSAMEDVLRISDRDHDAWNRAKYAIAAIRSAPAVQAEQEPVSQPYTLPEPITRNDADGWWMYKGRRVGGGCAEWYNRALDDCRAAIASGNSPAIPDGYALVPVEPTDLMVEAMYRHPLSMRGALKAAIEAAPKQDVK